VSRFSIPLDADGQDIVLDLNLAPKTSDQVYVIGMNRDQLGHWLSMLRNDDALRAHSIEQSQALFLELSGGHGLLPAPLGYADCGKGKRKELGPVRAPLVKKAFELYATGSYNLERLGDEMWRLGLRNRKGGRVSMTGLSTMLNNPFYIGLIRVEKTNESFQGIHEPLITKSLFDRVQRVLTAKTKTRSIKHDFLFRRLLICRRAAIL